MNSKGVVLVCLLGLALCTLLALASPAAGQTYLGTVDDPVKYMTTGACPTSPSRYFYSDPNMVCWTTTVRDCPNTDPLTLVYGVDLPTSGPYNGTIVMFAGDGGTYAGQSDDASSPFNTYAAAYLKNGYQIVQIAWGATYPGY